MSLSFLEKRLKLSLKQIQNINSYYNSFCLQYTLLRTVQTLYTSTWIYLGNLTHSLSTVLLRGTAGAFHRSLCMNLQLLQMKVKVSEKLQANSSMSTKEDL